MFQFIFLNQILVPAPIVNATAEEESDTSEDEIEYDLSDYIN